MKAKDLGTGEAHDEPLHLLLVSGKVGRLDAERVVAREAEHGLELRVPRHRVGVGLLVDELLGLEVVHLGGNS